MNGGPWRVTIRTITEEEFWAHGYDFGYDDGARGRPHRLESRRPCNGRVIPFPSARRRGDIIAAADGG